MSYGYTPDADDKGVNKYVYLCVACGVDVGYVKRKYCNDHLTAKGRAQMEKENAELPEKI